MSCALCRHTSIQGSLLSANMLDVYNMCFLYSKKDRTKPYKYPKMAVYQQCSQGCEEWLKFVWKALNLSRMYLFIQYNVYTVWWRSEIREDNCSTCRIVKEIREDNHLLCLPEHSFGIKHIGIFSSTEEHFKKTSLISN